jgi:hypothetical protein
MEPALLYNAMLVLGLVAVCVLGVLANRHARRDPQEETTMRRHWLALAVALGAICLAPSRGQAQFVGDGTGDPFFLYYGFYLPRQAALAASPRPENIINDMAAIRQQSALTERAGLYDPASPFGAGSFDPSQPFGDRRYGRRTGAGIAAVGTSINGSGPPMYYNRHAAYYPTLRVGRGSYAGAAAGGRQRVGGAGSAPYPSNPIGFQLPRTR